MASSSEETPRRSPRKRARRSADRTTRKTTTRRAAAKPATKKATPKKVEREERVAPAPERKAPTPIASSKASKKRRQKQLITAGVVLAIGVGASAAVGFTDRGQIDVKKTIEERNERIRTNKTDERDVNTSLIEVPVQNTNNLPNGGLVGRGIVEKEIEPVATSTATTTEETAPSTDQTPSGTEEVIDESAPTSDEIIAEPESSDEEVETTQTETQNEEAI